MVTPSLSADTRYILLLLVFYFWCGEHYKRDNDSISFLRVQQTHTKDPLSPPTSNSSLWKMGATSGAAFRRKNKTNQQNKNKKQWIIIFITIRQELINANGLYCGIFKQKKIVESERDKHFYKQSYMFRTTVQFLICVTRKWVIANECMRVVFSWLN